MKIINPKVELVAISENPLKTIETAARTCYKSEDYISNGSDERLVKSLMNREHYAMLEFGDATLRFTCDRGVTHEIVRHRMASYAQESTRYCNYSKDKFNNEITVIKPCFLEFGTQLWDVWQSGCEIAEERYFEMLQKGATPQEARSILPNSLKTEIIVKMNFREWLHFIKLRTASTSHPQMVEVAKLAEKILKKECPVIFGE